MGAGYADALVPSSLTTCVAQFAAGSDVAKNLERIEALTMRAKSLGSDLVVFPEASMYSWDAEPAELSEVAGGSADDFVRSLASLAQNAGMTLVVGMYSPVAHAPPHNRMVVVGPDGELRTTYDKVHLFDSFSWRESDKVSAAYTDTDLSELATVAVGGFTLGLLNCYDLRFPEMARALVDRGAEVLVVSSAWVAGPHKERHWETLLRARAIENTCYVVASNQPPPRSAGLSMVVDPMGLIAATCVADEDVTIHRLERSHLRQIRETVPSLQHRRYRVVASGEA